MSLQKRLLRSVFISIFDIQLESILRVQCCTACFRV